jgi:forespore regulator of the sigma-K checkpoint
MSSLLKRLRKILRRHQGLIAIGTIFLVFFLALQQQSTERLAPHAEEVMDVMSQHHPFTITCKTHYICGVETETISFQEEEDVLGWLREHGAEWNVEESKKGHYSLSRFFADDLSPVCKQDGHFSLNPEGVLTIYQGPPGHNRVIQTFFRIDTQRLESYHTESSISLQSLREGIRVNSIDDYYQVLTALGQFATR